MLKFNFFKPSNSIAMPEVSDASLAERAEQEKLTRRAALRRIGMAGGMAILGTLTIDDLARVSAKKLQENEVTRGIGESLAKEFKNAGVAIADTLSDNDGYSYQGRGRRRPPSPVPPSCQGHNANASDCKRDLHDTCVARGNQPARCVVIMDTCQQEAGIDDLDVTQLVACYHARGIV